MEAEERIICRGHPLVRGTHPTTFEVTTEGHLTRQGDCIIGVWLTRAREVSRRSSGGY